MGNRGNRYDAEFNGEFTLEYGNFFNQPSDEYLVVFNQSGGLTV